MFICLTLLMTAAPDSYNLQDLGCISDGQCYAMVINELDQVAGYGDAPNGMSQHGFMWDGEELQHIVPLNYPNGGQIWAYGINDESEVVGYSSNGGISIHAFMWKNGETIDLGKPEWADVDFSRAQDINNNGVIVGMAGGVPYDLRGFIKQGDDWDQIPTFGGNESRAYSINDRNDVVGYTRDKNGAIRGYGIPNGNISLMTDLGDLGGGATMAFDVNNNREVIGQSKGKDDYWHSFVWTYEDGMTDLDTLGGNESYAWSINDAGVVVGKSQVPEGGTHGFIWMDGTMFDVNHYIVPDIDILIVNVRDINEKGVLAAVGEYPDGSKRPLLLTPTGWNIPEDINGDGVVNVTDLLAVINAWGPCVGCPEDINNDNQVNVSDLLAVISAWSS